jgi:hypothetical protein
VKLTEKLAAVDELRGEGGETKMLPHLLSLHKRSARVDHFSKNDTERKHVGVGSGDVVDALLRCCITEKM